MLSLLLTFENIGKSIDTTEPSQEVFDVKSDVTYKSFEYIKNGSSDDLLIENPFADKKCKQIHRLPFFIFDFKIHAKKGVPVR